MAWTPYQYETDPGKYVDPTANPLRRIGQALKGLAVAPVAAAANSMFGDKNGQLWNDSDPVSTFASRQVSRFETPAGGMKLGLPSASTAAASPAPAGNISGLNWQGVLPTGQKKTNAPRVVAKAPREVPGPHTQYPLEEAPPDANPLISENTSMIGKQFDSQAASITGEPGEYRYGADGTNGGFGLTRNADGTVEQMYTLRQRTPEENAIADADMARWEKEHPFGTEGVPQPVDMSPGSQGEWERERKIETMLNRPYGLKTGELVRRMDADAETAYNNQVVNGIRQQNADADSNYQGTMAEIAQKMLPGNLSKQQSDLVTSIFDRRKTAAQTGQIEEETKYIGPMAQAEMDYKKIHGNTLNFANSPEGIAAKAEEDRRTKAFSTYNAAISAGKTEAEAQAAMVSAVEADRGIASGQTYHPAVPEVKRSILRGRSAQAAQPAFFGQVIGYDKFGNKVRQ
jgi:hypothetical protein